MLPRYSSRWFEISKWRVKIMQMLLVTLLFLGNKEEKIKRGADINLSCHLNEGLLHANAWIIWIVYVLFYGFPLSNLNVSV